MSLTFCCRLIKLTTPCTKKAQRKLLFIKKANKTKQCRLLTIDIKIANNFSFRIPLEKQTCRQHVRLSNKVL